MYWINICYEVTYHDWEIKLSSGHTGRAVWLKIRPITTAHHALHLLISCLIYTSSTAEVSRESKQVKCTAEERGDMLIRCYSKWLTRTHLHWQMWIWSDWSDCQLCVPLSVLSLAGLPLASNWVCRHSISASLEARSCCSSDISACGGRQRAWLWTVLIFQVTG